MNKEQYFYEMRNTSAFVNMILKETIADAKKCFGSGVGDVISKFVVDRIDRQSPLLKPFLLRLCYELVGGLNWQDIVKVCEAVELINISSYQANYAFDGKHGNGKSQDKKNCFVASMITREMANQIVFQISDSSLSTKSKEYIVEKFTSSNLYIYLGQYSDMNELTINNFLRGNILPQEYLKFYEKRCFELSGRFTQDCSVLGGLLGGATAQTMDTLGRFGKYFGIGLHIVNDLADFIPPNLGNYDNHKLYQDQLSDLRHGKLTVPIFYVFQYGSEEEKNFFLRLHENPEEIDSSTNDILSVLINSGAVSYTKRYIKSYYKLAHNELKTFSNSNARKFLSVMISALRCNKYFFTMRNYKNKLELSNQ